MEGAATRSTLPTVTHDKIVDDCNIRSGSPKRLDLFLASFSYYACFRLKCCNCQLATGDAVVRYKYAIGVAFESFQSAHAGYTATRYRRSYFLRPNVVHAEMCRISDRALWWLNVAHVEHYDDGLTWCTCKERWDRVVPLRQLHSLALCICATYLQYTTKHGTAVITELNASPIRETSR